MPKYTSAPGAAAARSPSGCAATARTEEDAEMEASSARTISGEINSVDNAAPKSTRRDAFAGGGASEGMEPARTWKRARGRTGANERELTTDISTDSRGMEVTTNLIAELARHVAQNNLRC